MSRQRDWAPFALLLIDVQEDFWPPETRAAFPDFRANVGRLLATCRREGLEIVHLRACFQPDRQDWMARYKLREWIPCVAGTPGAELLPEAAAAPGEKIILKQTFDGFLNPELDAYLQARRKRFILVAGLVTSVCVLLTTISGAQRGYLAAVVADCCADDPQRHKQTLAGYPFALEVTRSDRFDGRHREWSAQLEKLRAYP